MERDLDENELRQLYELIPSGAGIYDVTGSTVKMVYLNDGYYQMIGSSRGQRRQYEGTNAVKVFHPDDLAGLMAEIAASIREKRVFEYKYRALISDGCYRWLFIRANHVPLDENTERFFAAYYDIDELVRAQEKQQENELLLEETLKHSGTSHFIYFIGKRRYEAVALPEQYNLLPTAMDDYPDSFIRYTAMPEEDAERYREMLGRIDEGAEAAECSVRMKYLGQYSWFHVSCRAVLDSQGRAERAVGTAVVIDRFHEAEAAFREEKKRLSSVQSDLLAVAAFSVTHDRNLEEKPAKPQGDIRRRAIYREAAAIEPALPQQSSETLAPLLLAAEQIPDAEERRRFILASSHAAMLRLYQDGEREKALQYRRYVNGRLIWVSTRITLMSDPVTGDVLAYFYTYDINDAMIYRRITAGIIEKNFDNVSYLDLETQTLYRTEGAEGGQTFTPQPYEDAVAYAVSQYVDAGEAENIRRQYDTANIRARLSESASFSVFYTAKQRAEELPGRPFRHMKSDFYYLDERKDIVVILQSDVTQVFEQERAQRESAEKALRSAEEARTLEKIVRNIPAGLIVYRKDASGIRVQLLNHRLCELVGSTEEEILSSDVPQLLISGVHPDDRELAKQSLQRLFSDENAVSIVYRNWRTGYGYFWISAVGQAIEEPDGAKTAYVLYSDATEQKRRETEFDKRVRELSVLNPNTIGVFQLDLTRNAIIRIESRAADALGIDPRGTADAFIEKCREIMAGDLGGPEDWAQIRREALISAFQAGKAEIALNFRYIARETDELRWATSYIYLAQNPRTGSVEALACTLDATEEALSRQIMSRISDEDYDYFALLDPRKGVIRFVKVRERCKATTPTATRDYDADIQYAFSQLMEPEECERCVEALKLDRVLRELERNDTYVYPFTIEVEGSIQKKQLRYEWLDESRDLLLLTRIDITEAFLREQEQVRRLAEALREAERANAAKSDFLSRMSHDIRTPLNGIIGMTYLTRQMDLPKGALDNLGKISTSSKFLLSLVNDILDMSKMESQTIELHPEPYPFEDFCAYLDAVIRPLCAEKQQTFILKTDPLPGYTPLVDVTRLNRIYFNLLSNAVKYTPEGGTVTLKISEKALPDACIQFTISVKDNGIGMSPEFQKRLFEPFVQENRDDNSEMRGSGLGLAIVKKTVEAMGGTVSVRSEKGRGTEFTVVLASPCISTAALKRGPQDTRAVEYGKLSGRHILLCEDHPLNQEIAKALLTEKGMLVQIAEDGEKGVDAFSQAPTGYFDCVLMDLRMPVMDGLEAARRIRALPRSDAGSVPIIAMTADAFTDDVQRCLDAGMNGHISKPIDPPDLYRALQSVFSGK